MAVLYDQLVLTLVRSKASHLNFSTSLNGMTWMKTDQEGCSMNAMTVKQTMSHTEEVVLGKLKCQVACPISNTLLLQCKTNSSEVAPSFFSCPHAYESFDYESQHHPDNTNASSPSIPSPRSTFSWQPSILLHMLTQSTRTYSIVQ